MSLSIVVLAAGEGKRMRSAAPKVLAPLAGRPLLAHVLDTARALSPDRLVVVHGHGGEAVRDAFSQSDIVWAEQRDQRGTAHALAAAMPEVAADGAVLVLYGDVPLLGVEALAPLVRAAGEGALALLSARFPDPTGYGRILRSHAGAVEGIVEERDASEAERAVTEVNTGVLAAPASRLRGWLPSIGNDNAQGEYYLTDTVALALADGVEVRCVEASDVASTRGVNDRTQLAAVEAELRRRHAAALLEAGVTLTDPTRIDVRGSLRCGKDVVIDPGCIFEGAVELGDGVRIGTGVVIRDSVIGNDASVRPYTLIESARVGEGAVVGPFARLRPGSELAGGVHVGNFVETKNARLGPGSKANHLAYLGDADIGAAVNVGAGVITCNYDGAEKHKTVIEDGAFIGTDCPLVAPVTVGADATVGAGSTVTEDVPPGKLALARSRQVIIDGWERPKKTAKK